jgi:hypothetical protein
MMCILKFSENTLASHNAAVSECKMRLNNG